MASSRRPRSVDSCMCGQCKNETIENGVVVFAYQLELVLVHTVTANYYSKNTCTMLGRQDKTSFQKRFTHMFTFCSGL